MQIASTDIYMTTQNCIKNGLFHFLFIQGYGCKNPGDCLIMFFPGVSFSRYIFPGGKFAQLPFSGWENDNVFSDIISFWGIKLTKIQFQGIYESDNHSFQDILVFKKLVVHTPVWIKNGIAQYSKPSKLKVPAITKTKLNP